MKRLLIAVAVAAITIPALAADVGASISIGQPGFYGRLDIGDYPQPQVVFNQPMAIEQVPMDRPPIYLRVPPGYAKHWRKHCREYNACAERALFVQDSWYNREYVPHYRKQHLDRHNGHKDDRHGNHANDHHGGDHDHVRDN